VGRLEGERLKNAYRVERCSLCNLKEVLKVNRTKIAILVSEIVENVYDKEGLFTKKEMTEEYTAQIIKILCEF
jgi:hypothetical protein